METIRRNYGSLAEFVDYATSASLGPWASSREVKPAGDKFYGTRNFLEAVDLTHGWHEGAAKLKRAAIKGKPKGRATRREVILREVGPGSLSMGNYLAGHPQPYVVMRDSESMRSGKGKIVKIAVNISVSAGVRADTIMARGGAVVALCQALESAGRRVEITVVTAVNGALRLENVITVKESFQKLNLPTLAFALTHPSMNRRIVWSARETLDMEIGGRFGTRYGSYGTPSDIDVKADIYLGRMFGGEAAWRDAQSAQEWVRAQAEAQGVKLSL